MKPKETLRGAGGDFLELVKTFAGRLLSWEMVCRSVEGFVSISW